MAEQRVGETSTSNNSRKEAAFHSNLAVMIVVAARQHKKWKVLVIVASSFFCLLRIYFWRIEHRPIEESCYRAYARPGDPYCYGLDEREENGNHLRAWVSVLTAAVAVRQLLQLVRNNNNNNKNRPDVDARHDMAKRKMVFQRLLNSRAFIQQQGDDDERAPAADSDNNDLFLKQELDQLMAQEDLENCEYQYLNREFAHGYARILLFLFRILFGICFVATTVCVLKGSVNHGAAMDAYAISFLGLAIREYRYYQDTAATPAGADNEENEDGGTHQIPLLPISS